MNKRMAVKLSMNNMTSPWAEQNSQTKSDSPRMFDRIAHRYDFLNRLLSGRRDVAWRKRLVASLPEKPDLEMLDLATGTGDVLLSSCKLRTNIQFGVGLDPAGNMLAIARQKKSAANLESAISFVRGDALRLPFASNSFDAITIAFGIRNIPDVTRSLQEMHRILKPGGKVLILEFSLPKNSVLRFGYLVYFRYILPLIGSFISGDAGAYRYLNQTVETFPYGQAFCTLMEQAGFQEIRAEPLTMGIATLYTGLRR